MTGSKQSGRKAAAGARQRDVVELSVEDGSYRLVTPNANSDYIQQKLHQERIPYELDMLRDLRKRLSPGDLVLDVGAHVGNHTLYLACICGCRVIAIEPNESLAKAILASALLNDVSDLVQVEIAAVGRHGGWGRFVEEIPENLGSQRVEVGEGDIRILALDELLLTQAPRAIKIDVEGMEFDVLQGAEGLVRTHRPMLYVECLTPQGLRRIANWLDRHDYGYWDTFNVTPTHLFLPNEQVDLSRRLARLHLREALRVYDTEEVELLKLRLHEANLKYREATQSHARFKEHHEAEVSTLRQEVARLERELSESRRQFAIATAQRSLAEEMLAKTRVSLTYQLGWHLKTAVKSPRGLVRLPAALWSILRQARARSSRRRRTGPARVTRPSAGKDGRSAARRPAPTPRVVPSPTTISQDSLAQARLLRPGPRSALRVAAILDEFSFHCFQPEATLMQLTPSDWERQLEEFEPEMLFVESAWRGEGGAWSGKIGHTSGELQGVVKWCRTRSIPTVFWNKEDPVHFQTFINTARLFDYVFTTDLDCIDRYKALLGHDNIYLLPFACQPALHNPIEVYRRKEAVSFAGAYYVRYPERMRDFKNLVESIDQLMPIEIYDRNYGQNHLDYQFPPEFDRYIVGTLAYDNLDVAYKGYLCGLNLNSIKQSQTMFARRVFELLACNTLTLSNFSRGLRLMFGDLVLTYDNATELVQKLREITASSEVLGKHRLAALRKVMREHTYHERLEYILAKVFGRPTGQGLPDMAALALAATQADADNITRLFLAQSHPSVSLILVGPDSIRRLDHPRIRYLTEREAESAPIGDVTAAVDWVVGMCAEDYYGPNYCLDLALATRYSSAEVVGKVAHYLADGEKIVLKNPDAAYQPANAMPARMSAVSRALVADENVLHWLTTLPARELSGVRGLAIDPYNYCCDCRDGPRDEVTARVNDLPRLYAGVSIDELQRAAEQIVPASGLLEQTEVRSANLAELFGNSRASRIGVQVLGSSRLFVASRLEDGRHEYLYASRDLDPATLTDGQEFRCHLETTPGLALSLAVLFLDGRRKRIDHAILQANTNATVRIPPGTKWIRLGLRVFSGGEAEVKRLAFDHRQLQPAVVVGTAKHLVLSNQYPSYEDLYRNAFVHRRVMSYAENGVRMDVFRFRRRQALQAAEFKGVDVLSGDGEALERMLSSGRYRNLLVHFLDANMWPYIQPHVDRLNVVVWVHGAEIQPWWRRDFYRAEAERALAKVRSEKRLEFWRRLLAPFPPTLKLVFVSRYLAQTAMEDLGVVLPTDRYAIMHNPIDTKLFSYSEKPVEQRRKILSIRPYASRLYANDLSVEAIRLLATKPWFSELEFRLIGDGPLFEETLRPLSGYSNVHIERRFLTQEEIALLHQGYGIFLTPTRMDSQGVSRDEAMSSGLVPVTNAVAAVPEFVDETCGILAPPEDAQALADGIADLYEKPEKFASMSQAAAERVRKQSASDMVIRQELDLLT